MLMSRARFPFSQSVVCWLANPPGLRIVNAGKGKVSRTQKHEKERVCRDMSLSVPSLQLALQSVKRSAMPHRNNTVLAEMKAERKNIQWEHTYVAGDKTFCIYLADSEGLIQEHAQRSGFPATIVTEVRKMIDPVTAEG